jgi:hypothetical protein
MEYTHARYRIYNIGKIEAKPPNQMSKYPVLSLVLIIAMLNGCGSGAQHEFDMAYDSSDYYGNLISCDGYEGPNIQRWLAQEKYWTDSMTRSMYRIWDEEKKEKCNCK